MSACALAIGHVPATALLPRWRCGRGLVAAVVALVGMAGLQLVQPLVPTDRQPGPAPAAPPAQATWPAGLQEAAGAAIAADAYQFAQGPDGTWVTTTPAQSLRSSFGPSGPTVRASGGGWALHLSLARLGRPDALAPVEPAQVAGSAQGVEYRRGPALTEWYRNDARGLYQGFTLTTAPPIGSGPLLLELDATGLAPALSPDGSHVVASTAGTPVLRYSGLEVTDTTGRRLPALLGVEGQAVQLRIDDASAAYPLTIDPLISTEEAHLFGSDAASGDRSGHSVAIAGDTAVVGAPFDDTAAGINTGSAYVFVRSGVTWTQQARLFASDPVAGDQFGTSVAISGNTVVVGAPHDYNFVNTTDDGSAYVFVRSGTAWSQQAHLFASAAASSDGFPDSFGISVAISGDTVVVGRPAVFTPTLGTVHVYLRTGTLWAQQTSIVASDAPTVPDGYGYSVAISGETLVVGMPFDSIPLTLGADEGSVYVYLRSGGTWSEQAHLFASDVAAYDNFGTSVAVSGNTLVVGAPLDDVLAAGADEGSAYVFVRSSGTWSEQAHLVASSPAAIDYFGSSVAVSADTVVVGVPRDDTPAFGGNSGSAYVFARSGATWPQQVQMFASDAISADEFGTSVAVSGDTAVVGAAFDDTPAGADAGSAYVSRLVAPPQADVSVINSDSPDPVVAGQNITYTITVANAVTGSTADNVVLTDNIPANTTVVSRARPLGWTCAPQVLGSTDPLSCTKDTGLTPADGNQVFKLVVKVALQTPASTSISNPATVSATGDTATSGNNVATETTAVTFVSSKPAVVRGSTNWLLRSSLTTGDPTTTFTYGAKPLTPLFGDWDANGTKTPGTFEAGMFKLNNAHDSSAADLTFTFGDARGFPVAGDFDGNGTDDVAVFRNGAWQVRYLGPGAPADKSFSFGPALSWPAVVPVAGDWNGDGVDGIGVYNLLSPATPAGQWNLRQTASGGAPTQTVTFGGTGLYPVVGDWNGDGVDSLGTKAMAGTSWALANSNTTPTSNVTFSFGQSNDLPYAWR